MAESNATTLGLAELGTMLREEIDKMRANLEVPGPDGTKKEPLLFLDSAEIELEVAIERLDRDSGGFEIKVCGIGFSLGGEDAEAMKSGNKLKLVLKPWGSPIGVGDDQS